MSHSNHRRSVPQVIYRYWYFRDALMSMCDVQCLIISGWGVSRWYQSAYTNMSVHKNRNTDGVKCNQSLPVWVHQYHDSPPRCGTYPRWVCLVFTASLPCVCPPLTGSSRIKCPRHVSFCPSGLLWSAAALRGGNQHARHWMLFVLFRVINFVPMAT